MKNIEHRTENTLEEPGLQQELSLHGIKLPEQQRAHEMPHIGIPPVLTENVRWVG
jgi:hypothetical protein